MRLVDSLCTTEFRIPSILLMENAARSSADIIRSLLPIQNRLEEIVILCGNGNNGGDGYGIARHLYHSYDICIIYVGQGTISTPEAQANHDMCHALGIQVVSFDTTDTKSVQAVRATMDSADCICDALIGLGAAKSVITTTKGYFVEPQQKPKHLSPPIKQLVEIANSSSAHRIAIDIPTGLMNAQASDDVVFHAHDTNNDGGTKNISIELCIRGEVWYYSYRRYWSTSHTYRAHRNSAYPGAQ